MDEYTASELAYKRGYADCKRDAVEIAQIKETKQYILQIFDNLIEIDKPLAYECNGGDPYYNGKVSAFEISRRLVNAALTDLCGE